MRPAARENPSEPFIFPRSNGQAQIPSNGSAIFRKIVKRSARAIEEGRKLAIADDTDAIHAMRIELTRVRAATAFFEDWIADAEWRAISNELTWLNAALGKARNCDVTVQYADERRYRRWARHSRRRLLRSQNKAHRRLAAELRSTRYGRLMSALHLWLEKHTFQHSKYELRPDGDHDYCEEQLRVWREKLCRRGRHIGALGRKQQHLIRIQSKYYRYMVDSLLRLDMTVSREDFVFSEVLKEVHQDLGELRDLRRLRKSVGTPPPHYRRRKRELISRVERSFRR